MIILCIFVSMVVTIKADYHDEVGIPLAARTKAAEDKFFAEEPEMESRVVGENQTVTNATAYPFMASLIIQVKGRTNMSLCGGALVDISRVVTAAHCLRRAKSIRIRLGSLYRFHGGFVVESKDYSKHPKYNPFYNRNYDIGVIRLPDYITVSDTVRVIRVLHIDEDEVVGEWATAAGWGITSDSQRGQIVDRNVRLSEVALQIIDTTECRKMLPEPVIADIVCTDGAGGRGVCKGDSGGPLFVYRNGTKVLVGIISHSSTGGCEGGQPSMFTRVKYYSGFVCCDEID